MTKREYPDVYKSMLAENLNGKSSNVASPGSKVLMRYGSSYSSADEKQSCLKNKIRSPKRIRRIGAVLQPLKSEERDISSKSRCEDLSMLPSPQNCKVNSSNSNKCDGCDDVIRIVRWKCDFCHTTDLEENYVLYADGRVSRKQNLVGKTISGCKHEKKTLLYVFHR